MEEKIFGGQIVESMRHNYIASIRHNGVHFCTGFLINDMQVLTAAQCLREFLINEIIPNFSEYTVQIEDLNLENKTSLDIENVIVHPKYDPMKIWSSFDVGLITVDYKGNLIINYPISQNELCYTYRYV